MVADLALALVVAWWLFALVAALAVRKVAKNPQALVAKMMQRKASPFSTGINVPPILTGGGKATYERTHG